MLNSWLLLIIISRWIMLWNKAVFCLEVLIHKCLQMWRHNDVICHNEYLICTLSEPTVPYVYSLQFLFKSTSHTWRYKRKCEWVFFLNSVYILILLLFNSIYVTTSLTVFRPIIDRLHCMRLLQGRSRESDRAPPATPSYPDRSAL